MKCSVDLSFYIEGPLRWPNIALRKHLRHALYTHGSFHKGHFARCYSDLRAGASPNDKRTRLSGIWTPTGGIAETSAEDSHAKLIRAGFLRQAHTGIFHMLPLGRRVQDKLEALIDKYMSKLNASKLALSSISSEELWEKSGRLSGVGSELFRFRDRKDYEYLLAPTHEEEITTLVSSTTTSYKELPVRLYQISRKYRDERRPRQGLLRSREFIMKDLYTFDYSASLALDTYHDVRAIYARLFNELKIPYLVADADSGNMGGNLSHEFHFPTLKGEDHVISCTNCNYVANEELAESANSSGIDAAQEISAQLDGQSEPIKAHVWHGISKDRQTLVNVWYPSTTSSSMALTAEDINIHAIKSIIPDLDPSIEHPLSFWAQHVSQPPARSDTSTKSQTLRLINLCDFRIADQFKTSIDTCGPPTELFWQDTLRVTNSNVDVELIVEDPVTGKGLNLIRIRDGDSCSRCSVGKLKVQKAIELGHTFHLGTRYSQPLEAMVTVPANLLKDDASVNIPEEQSSCKSLRVPMQMGCYGIGVSRIIGAVADTLADEKGLNWPRVMAPYEVIVIPAHGLTETAEQIYDMLSLSNIELAEKPPLDLILDDRQVSFPWKMGDADLVGYPVIIVVGRKWKKERVCEVQCRRLQVHEGVHAEDLPTFVRSLLEQL